MGRVTSYIFMTGKKVFRALLVIVLLIVAGAFFLFVYRMGANDAKVMADFSVAYTQYNQSISDFSEAVLSPDPTGAANTDGLESKANQALVVLNSKAAARISSLTKNDGDLMKLSLDIAALATEEFDTLMAYHNPSNDKGVALDLLAKQFHDLTNQRQAAYARYVELAHNK